MKREKEKYGIDYYMLLALIEMYQNDDYFRYLYRDYLVNHGIVWFVYPKDVVKVCEDVLKKKNKSELHYMFTPKRVGIFCSRNWNFPRSHTRKGNAIILEHERLIQLIDEYGITEYKEMLD